MSDTIGDNKPQNLGVPPIHAPPVQQPEEMKVQGPKGEVGAVADRYVTQISDTPVASESDLPHVSAPLLKPPELGDNGDKPTGLKGLFDAEFGKEVDAKFEEFFEAVFPGEQSDVAQARMKKHQNGHKSLKPSDPSVQSEVGKAFPDKSALKNMSSDDIAKTIHNYISENYSLDPDEGDNHAPHGDVVGGKTGSPEDLANLQAAMLMDALGQKGLSDEDIQSRVQVQIGETDSGVGTAHVLYTDESGASRRMDLSEGKIATVGQLLTSEAPGFAAVFTYNKDGTTVNDPSKAPGLTTAPPLTEEQEAGVINYIKILAQVYALVTRLKNLIQSLDADTTSGATAHRESLLQSKSSWAAKQRDEIAKQYEKMREAAEAENSWFNSAFGKITMAVVGVMLAAATGGTAAIAIAAVFLIITVVEVATGTTLAVFIAEKSGMSEAEAQLLVAGLMVAGALAGGGIAAARSGAGALAGAGLTAVAALPHVLIGSGVLNTFTAEVLVPACKDLKSPWNAILPQLTALLMMLAMLYVGSAASSAASAARGAAQGAAGGVGGGIRGAGKAAGRVRGKAMVGARPGANASPGAKAIQSLKKAGWRLKDRIVNSSTEAKLALVGTTMQTAATVVQTYTNLVVRGMEVDIEEIGQLVAQLQKILDIIMSALTQTQGVVDSLLDDNAKINEEMMAVLDNLMREAVSDMTRIRAY